MPKEHLGYKQTLLNEMEQLYQDVRPLLLSEAAEAQSCRTALAVYLCKCRNPKGIPQQVYGDSLGFPCLQRCNPI